MTYRFYAKIFKNIYFLQVITELFFKSDQVRKHSSGKNHSTADREVLGSKLSDPLEMIDRRFKNVDLALYWNICKFNTNVIKLLVQFISSLPYDSTV